MKLLLVVRHAKASRDDDRAPDFDRPLTERGRSDALRMGQRMLQQHYAPDRIVTSPAIRARDTARLIAGELRVPPAALQEAPDLYDANVADILAVVRGADARINTLMVVGHNPGLHEFIVYLSGRDIEKFPPAGVCALGLRTASWRSVPQKNAHISWFAAPKSDT